MAWLRGDVTLENRFNDKLDIMREAIAKIWQLAIYDFQLINLQLYVAEVDSENAMAITGIAKLCWCPNLSDMIASSIMLRITTSK